MAAMQGMAVGSPAEALVCAYVCVCVCAHLRVACTCECVAAFLYGSMLAHLIVCVRLRVECFSFAFVCVCGPYMCLHEVASMRA